MSLSSLPRVVTAVASGGHLWGGPRSGGDARLPLAHPAGRLTRITYDDAAEPLDAWSRDGTRPSFASSALDIAGTNAVVRVRSTGGPPAVVAGDQYASEYFAQPSPALLATLRG